MQSLFTNANLAYEIPTQGGVFIAYLILSLICEAKGFVLEALAARIHQTLPNLGLKF